MWEPQPLATLGASTACNRDIFTFLFYFYIERDRKATWYEGMDRIHLAHGKETVMEFLVAENADDSFTSWATVSFWTRILSHWVVNESFQSITVPSM
jgi:hypothetical protein